MIDPGYLTCIIICGLAFCVKGDDCVYKVCVCDGAEIKCQYQDLTSLPPLTGERTGLGILLLDNNKITTIPAGSLPSNLTKISLMNNPITTIEQSAFDGSAGTLNTILFAQAKFTRIPDAFRRLTALQSLTIYDTNIQDWNLDAMKNVGSTMKTIYFENVGLTTWPDWFYHFNKLTDVSLVSSSISDLPYDALNMLEDILVSLTFITSNLKLIPKTFSNLKKLEHLQVQNNKISNITWLPQPSQLIELCLSSNNIADSAHLSNSLRVLEHSLSDLKLSQNQLSSIPDLSYLTKVGSLDFSNNLISDPTSGSLPANLYYLDLSNNHLSSIPAIYFNLPVIKDLLLSTNSITEIRASQIPIWTLAADLGHNLIRELTDTSFPENASLTMLNLMNNPLTKISILAFKNLQYLTSLNLQGTRLTRLPLALTSLVSLNYLDISNNLKLVCTCMEKSLETRITSLTNPVLGGCGLTTIYVFFTSLSPGCPSF